MFFEVYNVHIKLKGGFEMRINMTMNDELLRRVDRYAELNYMNRSNVVSVACNQFLITCEMQTLIIDVKRAIQKIAEVGTISDEDQKVFAEFAVLAKMINPNG